MRRQTLYFTPAALIIISLLVIGGTTATAGISLTPSPLEQKIQQVQFEQSVTGQLRSGMISTSVLAADSSRSEYHRKSPAKAFLLSLAVPGLGQYYYGSRIKPFVFLGVEIASWGLYAKWHSDGNSATHAFEAFANAHWHEADYTAYLNKVYGVTDDEDASGSEVTHHLPDTKVQQYYEMIGKYDQFSWGWDDAWIDSMGVTVYDPWVAVTGPGSTPHSANRDKYELMREDANSKFDKATRMIFVSMANRLISAFEAYLTVKSRNKKQNDQAIEYSRINVEAQLLSYNESHDTPFVKLSLRF